MRKVLERGRGKITGQIQGRGQERAPGARRSAHHRPGGAAGRAPRRQGRRRRWWPRSPATRAPAGRHGGRRCCKVLGDPDDPRTEVEKILACADVTEEFPAEVVRAASHVPERGAAQRPQGSGRPAPHPLPDHRSRDRARLRRRRGARAAARRRQPAVGGGGRRLALRARGQPARHRGPAPRGAASTCPTGPSRCCPRRSRRNICSLVPEAGSPGHGGAHRLRSRRRRARHRLRRGGDPLARPAGLPRGGRRRWPARRGASARSYEPFVADPARRWTPWRAKLRARRFARGALDLDLPEAGGRAGPRRSAAGARRAPVARAIPASAGPTR